jgi:hypothetical protein
VQLLGAAVATGEWGSGGDGRGLAAAGEWWVSRT